MRILFTSFPAYGHLHPIVPLALAAQAAGHDVRLATGPNLVGWVGRCGLPAVPVGLALDEAEATATRDFDGPTRTGHLFTDVWVGSAVPGLLDLATEWPPDLVVHEEQEYAAVLVAALLGVPCVTHSWSAPARPRSGREAQQRLLEPVWQHYLPGRAARRVGQLYLDACPPPFQTEDRDEIARTTRVVDVRPTSYDGPATEQPTVLRGLARPAVYLTLGTVPTFSTPEALRHIASALAPGFATVVVTAGPNDVEDLADLPDNVRVLGYLPQSLVLPLVDLVVSHGGAGGTLGTVTHGLPHLVLPGDGMSQVTIAAAVERIGVGLRLLPDQRDPAQIADAARRLLTEPAFAAAARAVNAELEHRPGPVEVLALLEQLAG